jgi:ribose 5-phosphate isomerase B
MRVVIGSDHAGYEMKEQIVDAVKKFGHEVTDVGTHEPDKPHDYPDFAQLVARAIQAGEADRGVVICGSVRAAALTNWKSANRSGRLTAVHSAFHSRSNTHARKTQPSGKDEPIRIKSRG